MFLFPLICQYFPTEEYLSESQIENIHGNELIERDEFDAYEELVPEKHNEYVSLSLLKLYFIISDHMVDQPY